MKKLSYVLTVLLLAVAIMPTVVLAQFTPGGGFGGSQVEEGNIGTVGAQTGQDIVDLIMALVNWFAWIVGLAAVVMGLYSAVLFITAAGDDAKVKKAKDILIYSIVGIIVAILSFGIISVVRSLTGF